MAKERYRMFYPSYLSLEFFTSGWDYFLSQELFNLGRLFFLVLLWHYFVVGFCFTSLVKNLAFMIAFRRFLAGGICNSTKKLNGQTVIITGANVGIGKETARDMLNRGARVILACRDVKKAEETRTELLKESSRVEVRKLDLSSLESVREFTNGIIKDGVKVHILINNAGVMMCPYTETAEGFELQMGTNHLGHFLLTNLLLPQMEHGEPVRIVNLSSAAHYRGEMNFNDFNYKNGYDKSQAYGNSKLANVLFTRQLAKVISGRNIQVFSCHPGIVHTNLGRHVDKWSLINILSFLLKTASEGAQTSIYCATEAKQHPCMYFSDCAVGWPQSDAVDDSLAEKLWKLSAELVKLDK